MTSQMFALVVDTIQEARARKVIAALLLNGTLSIAALFWILRTYPLSGPTSMVTLMSHTDYRYLNAQWVARGIFGNASLIVYSVQLLLCLMTTMSLVPSLLDPARNAWIVSHPLSRASILLGRFLGCMVLAAGSFVYTFLGAWLVTGLKVNLWHWPFFFGILTTLLLYCSLFAAMLSLHLLSTSPTLMASGTMAIGMFNIAASRPNELHGITGGGWLYHSMLFVSGLLPKAAETAHLTNEYVQTGSFVSGSPLWTSGLFGAACLALAAWRFSRKDL